MDGNQTFGMTSAINTAAPKESDILLTKKLEDYLKESGMFETDAELHHRFEVLGKLNNLVKEWIKDVSLNVKHMPPQVAETVGGKICTFGSFRLGVAGKGADIDALCVAPRHIDRSDYFTSFYELLKKQPEVTEMRAVEDAFVPVIKMKYEGIEIDMLFARLALKEVPDDVDLKDDKILKNLDEKCVRSLNGCRVTDEILRQVPNRETFKLALRAIKLWAKRHNVYSNVLGYLGGVSWAMLVARTCQLYPNAAASTIVEKLFLVFSRWSWPAPVYLKQPYDAKLLFKVWDPRLNIQDRFHLMPIITPAYPQQNSTFNISNSTKAVLVEAFNTSLEITQKIISEKGSWEPLFTTPNFFSKYKHFLVVLASAKTSEDFLEWYGLVESKIRRLIGTLEYNLAIKTIHINPNSFTTQDEEYKDKPHAAWFLGIDFKKSENVNIDLTSDINKFVEVVYVLSTQNKAYKDGMEINCKYVKRKQLCHYLSQETLDKYRGNKDDSQTVYCSVKRKSDACIPTSPEQSITDTKKLKVKDEAHKNMANGDAAAAAALRRDSCENSLPEVIPITTISDDIDSGVTQRMDGSYSAASGVPKKGDRIPKSSFDETDNEICAPLKARASEPLNLPCSCCTCVKISCAITLSTPSHGSIAYPSTSSLRELTKSAQFSSPQNSHYPVTVPNFHPMFVPHGLPFSPFPPFHHTGPQHLQTMPPIGYPPSCLAVMPYDQADMSERRSGRASPYSENKDAASSSSSDELYYSNNTPPPPSIGPFNTPIHKMSPIYNTYSPFLPQYNLYSCYMNPMTSPMNSSNLQNSYYNNGCAPVQLEHRCSPDCCPKTPSRVRESDFNSSPERSFSTPPRGQPRLKRSSSHLSLPCRTPSPPNSPSNHPSRRVHVHPHRNFSKLKSKSNNNRSNHSSSHNNVQNYNAVTTTTSYQNSSSLASREVSFSKICKPSALVLARQRLPSHEIPDVLSPNTPKLVPIKQQFQFNINM